MSSREHEATIHDPTVDRATLTGVLWQVAVPVPAAVERRLGKIISALWIVFVVSVLLFEPTPESTVVYPAWATAMSGAFWLALVGAGVAAIRERRTTALSLSLGAGVLGGAIGFACAAVEHHTGVFPVYGIGMSGALAWLSVAALRPLRGSAPSES